MIIMLWIKGKRALYAVKGIIKENLKSIVFETYDRKQERIKKDDIISIESEDN